MLYDHETELRSVFSVTFPVHMLNQCWLNKRAVLLDYKDAQSFTAEGSGAGLFPIFLCLLVSHYRHPALSVVMFEAGSVQPGLCTHTLITPICSSWKELSEMQCEAICLEPCCCLVWSISLNVTGMAYFVCVPFPETKDALWCTQVLIFSGRKAQREMKDVFFFNPEP